MPPLHPRCRTAHRGSRRGLPGGVGGATLHFLGMMVGGQVIAPPNPETDTATLAVYADGRVDLGAG